MDPHLTHGSLGPPEYITQMDLDRFCHFCTAYVRLWSGMPGHLLSLKITPSHGAIWLPCNTWFLGPPESKSQTVCRSIQPFLHRWPQSVLVLYNGPLLLPLKTILSHRDVYRYLIRGSLGSPESSTQTVQPFLQGSLVWQTDRQITLLGL